LIWFKGPLAILPLWTFIPIGVAITVLAALTMYRIFENPVTRWLNGDKSRQSQRIVDRLRRPVARETATV
jgi:peptidoglycan/LPS O-acetylase OafA/YrhL